MAVIASILALVAPSPTKDAVMPGRVPTTIATSARSKAAIVAPYRARFERIAQCESGGRWWINTGNGFYGGLQFTLSSWRGVGGWGYPHQNTKLEQMYRGVRLMWTQGWGAWPVCSRR